MRGAGQIADLAALVRPDIGIITNIGLAHLELLGTPEAIASAKAELLAALPADGLAIYPDDTGYDALLRATTTARRRCIVGSSPDADYRACEISFDERGCATAQIQGPNSTMRVELSTPGAHVLADALLVVACAQELGVDDPQITRGLASAATPRAVPIVLIGRRVEVIDDSYNANPDSMAAALRTLALAHPSGRRIAVLGDMLELGEASEGAHRGILELAHELGLEYLFVFGSQFSAANKADLAYDDIDQLTSVLDAFLRPGDLILVKGSRGMRMERVIDALKGEENRC
jgi:UDP-N-acetylmuramoyl-tripeptide--D-alanyl-D-alanine ligase